MRRVLFLKIALGLVVAYLALVGGLFAAMRQPPAVFGRIMAIMARMPSVAFVRLPFKPLWMAARAGHLAVGDPAPDFSLESVDRKARVQLSSHRGQRPVVLVFGSYT